MCLLQGEVVARKVLRNFKQRSLLPVLPLQLVRILHRGELVFKMHAAVPCKPNEQAAVGHVELSLLTIAMIAFICKLDFLA